MFKCFNVPMFKCPNVQMSNVKCQMSNVKWQMSNIKCQMMSIRLNFCQSILPEFLQSFFIIFYTWQIISSRTFDLICSSYLNMHDKYKVKYFVPSLSLCNSIWPGKSTTDSQRGNISPLSFGTTSRDFVTLALHHTYFPALFLQQHFFIPGCWWW